MVVTSHEYNHRFVGLRLCYKIHEATPSPRKLEMVTNISRQFGKSARLDRSMVIYDYENKHSEKALEMYENTDDVDVVFVKEEDEASEYNKIHLISNSLELSSHGFAFSIIW